MTAPVRSSTIAVLDEILRDPGTIRELEPSLFSAMPDGSVAAAYDRKTALYDAIVGRSLYNRVLWGTSPRSFARFGRAAIDAAHGQWFAEAGCGSLLFTHGLHGESSGPPSLLMDRSLGMLRSGLKRLRRGGRGPRRDVAFLQTDVATVPARSGVFRSILSLNLLHVPCDAARIARELGRLLMPGVGRLFVSCIVRSGRWSDACLRFLHRTGELAAPWTAESLVHAVPAGWGVVESTVVEGNLCFLVIRHAGLDA